MHGVLKQKVIYLAVRPDLVEERLAVDEGESCAAARSR